MTRAARGAAISSAEWAVWAAFLLLVAVFGFRKLDDSDMAVHILAGREILETHRIPDVDHFSFTVSGAPWFVNQWVPEVIFAAVERVAGLDGLVWLRAALLVAAYAILALAVRGDPRVGGPAAVAALLLAVYAPFNLFLARPLLFSSLFLAIEILILEEFRSGRRDRVFALPPLFALWVNCHAGYVFGAILLAAVLAGESIKRLAAGSDPGAKGARAVRAPLGPVIPAKRIARLALATAAAIAASFLVATLVNPRGFATVLLPFGMASNKFFLTVIGEYSPAGRPDWIFFVMASALAIGLIRSLFSGGARTRDLTDWLVALPFAFQAWRTHRVIFPFAIVAAPAVGRALALLGGDAARALGAGARAGASRTIARDLIRRAVPWAAAAAILAAAGVRVVSDPLFGTGLSFITYPREACIRFLRDGRFRANLFHSDIWAGAVALFGSPRYRLFIDGRLEVYGEAFWRDVYFRVLGCGPGWEEVLTRYDVNAALLRVGSIRRRDRIGSVLRTHPDWALVYWDETSMLYVRRIPEHAGLIARREAPPEVDPENLTVPVSPEGLARFLAAMERALAEDPTSVPALYGAVVAGLATETAGEGATAGGGERVARLLPFVRAAERERVGRGDWRLRWIEGKLLLATGDADGAMRALDKANRIGGADSPDLLVDRVVAAALASGADAAGRALDRGAARIARAGGARGAEAARAAARLEYLAGRTLARAGEGDTARLAYAAAARDDPSRSEYETARAWSFVLDGRYDDAVRAATEGLARFPRNPYLAGTRGWALFRSGRAAEGEADVRAALAALPEADVAARAAESAHLGEILLARGAGEEARALLARAVADSTLFDLAEVARARDLLDSLAQASR